MKSGGVFAFVYVHSLSYYPLFFFLNDIFGRWKLVTVLCHTLMYCRDDFNTITIDYVKKHLSNQVTDYEIKIFFTSAHMPFAPQQTGWFRCTLIFSDWTKCFWNSSWKMTSAELYCTLTLSWHSGIHNVTQRHHGLCTYNFQKQEYWCLSLVYTCIVFMKCTHWDH